MGASLPQRTPAFRLQPPLDGPGAWSAGSWVTSIDPADFLLRPSTRSDPDRAGAGSDAGASVRTGPTDPAETGDSTERTRPCSPT